MVDTPGRIPEDFIQAVLSRVDIIEVIGNSVPLRKAGTSYVACCPFHKEKTPSFSVNQQKQFYHCFGCGVSGDAIQFLIEHNSISFVEAVELLAAQVGLVMPNINKDDQFAEHNLIYNILAEAMTFFEQQLRQHILAKQAVQYLKDRDLTGVTAKDFKLGFAPPGWDNLLTNIAKDSQQKELGVKAGLFVKNNAGKYYDRFRNRIMFPIRNRRGKVIGFGARVIDGTNDEPKYLNSPETTIFNKSQELYGYYEARAAIQQQQNVLVVEGYMDVVMLAQHGIKNVVATLGTACTEQHIQQLFKTVPEIIFSFDGDAAGRKAAWRALELCLPLLDDKHRIKFLLLRNNEDPDSFVRKHGGAALQEEIKRAASLTDFLFDSIAKQVDLSQIDGKVQFANLIKQQLVKLPEGIYKAMLFDRLAKVIDIDPAALQEKKAPIRQNYRELSHTIVTKKGLSLVSPAIRALAMLVHNRALVAEMPDLHGVAQIDIAGCPLFFAVCQLLLTAPHMSEQEIKTNLPGDLSKNFDLMALRAIARIVPKDGIRLEFLGAIGLLRKREKELQLDNLLHKAGQNTLSADEKRLLQQMLQEKG